MSLLLLRNRKVQPKEVEKDYPIWDQVAFDQDEGPQEQKKKVSTLENQLGFLMRKTWRTPIPVGTIVQFAGTTAPIGWLFCNGASLSIDQYLDLYQVISTTYGGNGVTTFNVPDFRRRVPVGFDPTYSNSETLMDLSLNRLGIKGGELEHTLTIPEMPSHDHSGNTDISGNHVHGITDPGHTHSQTTINDDFNNSGENPPGFTADSAGSRTWNNINESTTGISINEAGAHRHGFTTQTKGGNQPHNIMQPYVVINYIIRC